eukprot:PhF_6_TR11013/c0_g1_i2/m.17834
MFKSQQTKRDSTIKPNKNQTIDTDEDEPNEELVKPPSKIKMGPKNSKFNFFPFVIAAVVVLAAIIFLSLIDTSSSSAPVHKRGAAMPCFCLNTTNPSLKNFNTAVVSTSRRPRNLGFAVHGTQQDFDSFVQTVLTCDDSKNTQRSVMHLSSDEWEEDKFLSTVTSATPLCRILVIPNFNVVPNDVRANLKSLLDQGFWTKEYTTGHISLLIRFPPVKAKKGQDDKETDTSLGFASIQEQRVMDDRVLHLLNH